MTTFEWSVLSLVLMGMVLPVWIFFGAAWLATKRPKQFEPSARFFAYAKVIQSLHDQMDEQSGKVELGPLWAATVRELREYREFSDLSLLYLEEINITGSKKFDQVMKAELGAAEAHLLQSSERGVERRVLPSRGNS